MPKHVQAPIKVRIKNSLKGVGTVLRKPSYVLLALGTGFFISGFIIWSLNFDLVQYIIFDAPISTTEKLRFFWDVQTGIYSAYQHTQATGIILFGYLFGINISMITYAIRKSELQKIPKKSGGAGLILAMFSGGCVACGTSILAPVLATFGATSSAFAVNLSNFFNWAGSVLIIYSIYKLGTVVQNSKTKLT